MLNFAEQTGSGAVIIVWYYLISIEILNHIYCTHLHNTPDNHIHIGAATYYYAYPSTHI